MVVASRLYKGFPVRTGSRGKPGWHSVLEDIAFEVNAGEFVSVVGPSGCGKTTLLRVLGGLIRPDRGRTLIGGQTVLGPTKDASFVFQSFGLYPWRTVLANVEFALELDGIARAERRQIAREHIGLVGLRGFERHYPHEISGGMQQRVGIARALTRKPSVLLMDEPFGSLDAQTRENLQEEFLRIWERTGTTVVFVTHSIDEAVFLSNRVVVLSSSPGRVREIIPVDLPHHRLDKGTRSAEAFIRACAHVRELLREAYAQAEG